MAVLQARSLWPAASTTCRRPEALIQIGTVHWDRGPLDRALAQGDFKVGLIS